MARKLSLIALILLVLYALAGFIILPWWLARAVPDRLDQHMGWQATIEKIEVNPFAMSIQATGLSANDSGGEPVLAFDRLYVNLGVLRLATGIVALQNFELDEPFARLDLREDYSVNFARDWQANNPAGEPAPKTDDQSSDPAKLFLDRLRIAGGEVLFRDFSQSEPEEFQITPLDLALDDLATWPRDGSDSSYYLLAAIGSQTVEWEGDLSIAPFYSNGFIRVADVNHSTLSHFLKPYLPYTLRDGNLTISTNYELRSGEQFALSTSGGDLTVTDLALGLNPDSEASLLETQRIQLPGISFGLINRELAVGNVVIDGARLDLERDEDGLLNLLRPFQGDEDTAENPSQAGETGSPFRWSVAGVALNDGQVNWRDRQPEPAVDLTVEELNLTLGRLSHELGEPVDYEAALALADGGQFNLRGQTTLQPFTLEAGLGLTGLNLAQLDGYLGDATNLTLREGLLNLDGNLDLDNQQEPMTGTFSGNGQVSSLDLRLADSDSPVLAWQNLRLEPLEYNLAPARLEIGTLTLSSPNVNVVREADGLHNLARILSADPAPSAAEEPPEADAEPASESEAFIFRIGQIMLESGEVSYADRTLEPVFSTRIDRLNGSVTGLSNVPPQQGKVSMQGRVGDVASLMFDGSIGTLGSEDVSNLTLKVDGVSLPALSPYLGRYLGYGVQSGKLNLDLDYEIAGSRIDAANRIRLDRMELGDAIASEQAVNAPVKLGLALLRDRKGVIDIDLPIEGDLADPQFSVGPVIMRTFVNLVARAATSPFSVLGSLADMTGLTGEELGYVSFDPGRVDMVSDGMEKLEVLSGALEKRPDLLLKVRGAVSPEVDGEFLRRQRLAEQLGISQTASATDRIARLESRYQDAGFEQPLASYRQEVATTGAGGPDDQAWEKALVDRLISRVVLPPEVLSNLARSRGVLLTQTLQEEFDVPESQLFLLEPLQDAGQDDRGAVKVNFELEAR
ncbi:DUF748 domain-containing protein [Marinobacter confluentis]|uniref:DUF748 domain-containing protein n=1 Tax=Marinobacter confluentis TaxID=1697557 RepID=UPI001CD9B530|nr:DUF748 domain-containing protein [Marinobacter confluentis]